MAIFYLTSLAPILPLVLLSPQTHAQSMSPDPVFNCQDPNFRVIYTACSANDYSRCCAVGTSCCAGGCCDLTHNCLNVGTSNEVCCSADDPTSCGYGGSGTTPPYAVQSVACTGSDGLSSYYCPPGATCNSDENSCIGGSSGGGGGSVAPASSATAASSAPAASVPAASSAIASPSVPVVSSVPAASSAPPVIHSSGSNETPSPQPSAVTVTASALAPPSSQNGFSSPGVPTVTVEQSLTPGESTPTTSGNNQPATVTVTPSASSQKSAASRKIVLETGFYTVVMWLIDQIFIANLI